MKNEDQILAAHYTRKSITDHAYVMFQIETF